MTHQELKEKALEKPEVKQEYEMIGVSLYLLQQMLEARREEKLSQEDVANRMGVKRSAVARLESSLVTGNHSPTLATLQKYAQAVGCTLEIRLVKEKD